MSISLSRPFLLLVEDSEDDAFFFRDALRRAKLDHELVHVADGQAAIDHLTAVASGNAPRPDLVFLDLKMPGLNGFDVLTWLAGQAALLPLTVFVLSGSEHATDIARAKALGAAGYYVKPITGAQLRERLASLTPSTSPPVSLTAASGASPPHA